MHKSIDQRLAALEALEREQEAAQPLDVAEIAALSDEDVMLESIHAFYTTSLTFDADGPRSLVGRAAVEGPWMHALVERLSHMYNDLTGPLVPLWLEDVLAAIALIERGELSFNAAARQLMPKYGSPNWTEGFRVACAVRSAHVAVAAQLGVEPRTNTEEIAAWLRSLIGDDDADD